MRRMTSWETLLRAPATRLLLSTPAGPAPPAPCLPQGVPERDTKQLIAYAREANKVVIGPATVGGVQARCCCSACCAVRAYVHCP